MVIKLMMPHIFPRRQIAFLVGEQPAHRTSDHYVNVYLERLTLPVPLLENIISVLYANTRYVLLVENERNCYEYHMSYSSKAGAIHMVCN